MPFGCPSGRLGGPQAASGAPGTPKGPNEGLPNDPQKMLVVCNIWGEFFDGFQAAISGAALLLQGRLWEPNGSHFGTLLENCASENELNPVFFCICSSQRSQTPTKLALTLESRTRPIH